MATAKQLQKEMERKAKERQLKAMAHEENRAQSITIGNSGGGTTEISMRGVCGGYLWNVYQPAEVIELINQLSAAIGCHIHIQPRNDFSSWREWKQVSEDERQALNGFVPFAQLSAEGYMAGTGMPLLPGQRNMPKLETKLMIEEDENVAIDKPQNKRKAKRARSSSK